MRHLLVAGAVLLSTDAIADSKAIEKAVKTNIVQIGKLANDDKLAITTDALLVGVRGTVIDLSEKDGCVTGAVANHFYGCVQASIDHKPGAVVSGFDGDVGWFSASYVVTVTGDDPDGNAIKSKETQRISGVIVKSGKDWKIAAAVYQETLSDKDLFARPAADVATGEPKLSGDKKLAAIVAGWFKSGFATNAATKGTLAAAGTAPTEYKTAAAASGLVKSWDKLKLGATEIDAKLLAGGKIGWVNADVRMPRKKGKGAVAMQLILIAIPDGDGWKWVSLMYQPPSELG